MTRDGQAFALLIAHRTSARPFAASEFPLLAQIADALAPFIESALLFELIGEWDRRRQSFMGLNKTLAGSLDVRRIFEGLGEAVRPVFGFDILGIEVMTESGRNSERIAEIGGLGKMPRVRTIDDFSLSHELLAGRPLLIHDSRIECDPRKPLDKAMLDYEIRSLVIVPLMFESRSGGLLYLAKRQPHWFDEIDLETASALAGPVMLAMHHHRQVEQDKRIAAAEGRAAQLQSSVERLRSELGDRYGFERIIGQSKALRHALASASRVAPTPTTVLITGESGTGKELVAHAIHLASPRAGGPFVAINCAALPEALIESELFGHEKGAFTGAQKRKPGRFELAAGGTLFLDEVGELAMAVQAKLLRVIQEQEFQTVGGTATLKSDVRLVAATNRNLATEVERGRFRADLLYRLNVFQLHLPPLRERGDDVLVLADYFVAQLEARMGKSVPGISQEARDTLLGYAWPGNIRELQNAIERAMILSDGGLIQSAQLGLDLGRPVPAKTPAAAGQSVASAAMEAAGQSLPDWERKLVVEALQKAAGNKSKAAELLGVTRSQLYTRMKRFGL